MTNTTAVGVPAPQIQVIGAGLGRTGTLSLRAALTRLGFGPCDHMLENFAHPARFALGAEALRRKDANEPIDWRPLLTGYRAIVDWPGAHFWWELSAAHPDAKVILTVHDPVRWYDSIRQTIFSMIAEAAPGSVLEVPSEIVRDRTFVGRLGDLQHCQAVFTQHNRAVQEALAKDRLPGMPKTADYLYAFRGTFDREPHGVRWVRVFEEASQTPVIVMGELPQNTSTSVTNMAE